VHYLSPHNPIAICSTLAVFDAVVLVKVGEGRDRIYMQTKEVQM
jgi:hypothetical protein